MTICYIIKWATGLIDRDLIINASLVFGQGHLGEKLNSRGIIPLSNPTNTFLLLFGYTDQNGSFYQILIPFSFVTFMPLIWTGLDQWRIAWRLKHTHTHKKETAKQNDQPREKWTAMDISEFINGNPALLIMKVLWTFFSKENS